MSYKNKANKCWAHVLDLAGLKPDLDADCQQNRALDENWTVVKDWKVDCRYESSDEQRARVLYSAVAARQNGVLAWLRKHW